jgi:transcriptional regulator with XRE-family HTH domain
MARRRTMDYTIADRLAEMRRAHGYSQESLAAELGLTRQAVSRWERGESLPDTENLIALANLYDVTLDELVRPEAADQGAVPAEEGIALAGASVAEEKVSADQPATGEALAEAQGEPEAEEPAPDAPEAVPAPVEPEPSAALSLAVQACHPCPRICLQRRRRMAYRRIRVGRYSQPILLQSRMMAA